jgi:hypothetical protein
VISSRNHFFFKKNLKQTYFKEVDHSKLTLSLHKLKKKKVNLKEAQVELLTENPGSDQYYRLVSQFSKEQENFKKIPT